MPIGPRVLQSCPGGFHRYVMTDRRVLPTSGGSNPIRVGCEEIVHPGTDSSYGVSLHQQDRAVLLGAQGVAQKKSDRPDLDHPQASVCRRIPRPGRRNQGH